MNDLLAIAIPFFVVALALEIYVARKTYSFADSITSITCGIGATALEPFLRTVGLGAYVLLYEKRLITFHTETWWESTLYWCALFVAVDFSQYALHRAAHRVNLLWATHVVHHQSEEFNLSVSLRQSWFAILFVWPFQAPIGLLGFSPGAYAVMSTAISLYVFASHTNVIRRLPRPLEWLLNTPSHHRVHHSINPKYIDRNYGAVLILWDRLFGSFQAEEEKPVYGTVTPLASFNPLWANIHPWVRLLEMSRATPRLADKARVWFGPPEWRPQDPTRARGPETTTSDANVGTRTKYYVNVSRGVQYYVFVHFIAIIVVTTWIIGRGGSVPPLALALVVTLLLAEMLACAGLLEAKAWAVGLAIGRNASTVAVLTWFAKDMAMFPIIVVAAASASAIASGWLLRLRSLPSKGYASPFDESLHS